MNKERTTNIYKTRFKCKSINLSKFINTCTQNGITIFNLEKGERFSTFELSEQDSKKIQKLDLSNFCIEVERQGGTQFFKKFFLTHIGFILGLIVSMIALFCLQDRILQLHITGMSTIAKSDIEKEINTYGINYFSNINFDKAALEKYLIEKFDFSLVSIISKGNSLIVNVKESIRDIEDNYAPITADCNMIIKSIEVYAGTKVVDVGDIVFKGDILVQPYYKSNTDIVYVEPRAKIVADVCFSRSYKFLEKEILQVRSGKQTTLFKGISLGDIPILNLNNINPFKNFEIEDKTRVVANYFLPIVEKVIISFELVEFENVRDFEKEKENIISQLKELVYRQVFEGIQNIKEDIVFTDIAGGKIINFSITGEYVFKYM